MTDRTGDPNYLVLEERYLVTFKGDEALKLLETASDPDLSKLLRDHRLSPQHWITDPDEIRRRQSFDQFLVFCSQLEIAASARALSFDLAKDPLTSALGRHLARPSLRAYYMEIYPLRLPVRLHDRLQGAPPVVDPPDDRLFSLFADHLDLASIVETDADIGVFLNIMDGFAYGDVGLQGLQDLLADPARFFEHLAADDPVPQPLHRAARGFWNFARFSVRLDRFLNTLEGLPVFRSLVYQNSEYWYRHLKHDVVGFLKDGSHRYSVGMQKLQGESASFDPLVDAIARLADASRYA